MEYILVHEMINLFEPNHGSGFIGWMDMAMPTCRQYRRLLNQSPVRHESWMY
jgi:predicted metal-dependent hydrolase